MARLHSSAFALLIAIMLVAALVAIPRPAGVRAAAVLTVTTTADIAPPCSASLSLRCALVTANADQAGDTISFHIPAADPGCAGTPVVCTIKPSTALPVLTAGRATINGYSQPGASPNTNALGAGDNALIAVRLDGGNIPAGTGADGLDIAGSNDTVTGLAITNFPLRNNPNGTIVGGVGVHLIGSTTSGDGVRGVFIGLLPDGMTTGPNQLDGVAIDNAGGDQIGGSTPASANVISGNGLCSGGDCFGIGITINSGTGSVVSRNLIGTAAGGGTGLGNLATGVVVLSGNNTIGGNVVSANGGDGLLIGSSGNRFTKNLIGTTAAGMAALGNHSHGLDVQGATNSISNNLISANGDTGLVLLAPGNTVQGNRVGTNAAGTAALGNGFAPSAIFLGQLINGTDGIVVCTGPNTIGGSAPGTENLVSGNAGDGISLVSSGNLIQGNTVGTNAAGSAALPNGIDGIGSRHNLFKGTGFCQQAAQTGGDNNTITANLISGNTGIGVDLVMSNANTIMGNRIGTSAAGHAGVGNGGDGVFLGGFCEDAICHGSSSNTITGNVIGANAGNGIRIDGTGNGTGNSVQNNHIGTDPGGTAALGNGSSGVALVNGAFNDIVGGTGAGAGNSIAHNGRAGVLVGTSSTDAGSHDAIQRNSIFANAGLGIDLAPQGTVNCATSPPGPNDYTPCPVITSATPTRIAGRACAACTVEVFLATGEPDDQGHGEGATFLGSAVAGNTGTWALSLPAGQVSSTQLVTATATTPVAVNQPSETSEFAANAAVS